MTDLIRQTLDDAGIATWTIDVPGKSMNVFTTDFFSEMSGLIEDASGDPGVRGVVITSGKPGSFVAGADLAMLLDLAAGATGDRRDFLGQCFVLNRMLRRLETFGKPVAAALNGLTMGGGLELALACHYRVADDDPRTLLGLPEVKVGLLPGGGGTQRLPRLIGLQPALTMMLEGNPVAPQEALKLGILNAVAPSGEVLEAARAWLLQGPEPVQPWDRKGFKSPVQTGFLGSQASLAFTGANAMVQQRTMHNYPAPRAILSCVFEGCQLPMDRALRLESKYFASLLLDPVAANMIRSLFIHKNAADKLVRRPKGVPTSSVKRLGILGAGMMGSAIAYVAADQGMSVALLDRDLATAERGRDHARGLVDKAVARGKRSLAEGDALLSRITAIGDYAGLAGSDLVVEAVFEDRGVKADVTRRAEAVLPETAVFGSNTSTLPITGLAEASVRPAQFIGIHFFSPVDKMPLVEVILGRKTSDETLARTLDFVRQLRKTPIVVRDGRGFLTSRVCGAYLYEGMVMLREGVAPALIENAGRLAGMPVGPLALHDEVALDLSGHIRTQARQDLGEAWRPKPGDDVLDLMLSLGRIGRKGGKGFYEYPDGGRKFLWPGLTQHFPQAMSQPDVAGLKRRLLYIQVLETVQTMQDGVVTTAAEGDLGCLLGLGFPAYTGGPLSLVDTAGVGTFVGECRSLARKHGARFAPPRLLQRMTRNGEKFHLPGQ
jgi:3-hydroxyacyl-CoA dehydrogenase/enoyl-CoA hydratase/3-hydroxybutyryl-CoA epimerase